MSFSRAAHARSSEPAPMYGRRPLTQSAFGAQSYDGASTDAYSQRWAQNETTPDSELASSLGALRSRSADLVRNNALAYGIIETIQRGVNGRGPRFKSAVPGDLGETINSLFAAWTERAAWDGVGTWSDVCDDLISSACISGDVLIIWPDIGNGAEPRVDLVDARRIDTPTDRTPECASCRLGVGYDRYGRVLGYYVKASDEGSSLRENFRWFPLFRDGRINAYLFRRPSVRRPRQSRTVGILAPMLHSLKGVPEYLLTEGRRAAQAAKNFVVIETPDPQSIADAFENASGTGDADGLDQLLGRSYGNIPDGSMMVLGMGEKATLANPPQVNGGVGDYIEAHLRAQSPATGLPFEEAFRNYAKLNFSNARTVTNLANDAYRIWQDKVEAAICRTTIGLLIRYWWANGQLGRIRWDAALTAGSWHWDKRGWVDPLKETKAAIDGIAANIESIQSVAAKQGRDWRQIIIENLEAEQLEAEERTSRGLPPRVNPNAPVVVEEPEEPQDPADMEDENDV